MKRGALLPCGVALAARLAVVAWAYPRFPPAGDGTYYHALAARIAEGHGYTWAWPDGAVTYAAHYPVGYPAMLALGYALFGTQPVVGMMANALLGAAMAWGAYRLAGGGRRRMVAALIVGLHPALVPYTAALMTEGVTAALLVLAAAFAGEAGNLPSPLSSAAHPPASPSTLAWGWLVAAGVVMGIATLVRPQSLVLAPVLGWLAARGWRARAVAGAAVLGMTLLCCAPWTIRNCERMHRCALVSVNAGWNLFIGERTTSGAWEEVPFPDECRTVWDEAQKDVCLERVARRDIRGSLASWVAHMPKKLSVTFDYFGAAPWYLHTSNAGAFSERAKLALGALETVVSRLLLLGALVGLGVRAGARRTWRLALGALGVLCAVLPPMSFGSLGWAAYLFLAAQAAVVQVFEDDAGLLFGWTAAVIGATAVTHGVFFGAGRYGLVVVPFVSILCAMGAKGSPRPA